MNEEDFTIMDEHAIDKNDEQNAFVSEDGSNDSDANNNVVATYDESSVCIQELNEHQIAVVDRKRLSLYEKWIPFFAADGIALQDEKLVCTICRKQISADKKSRLSEHIGSKKHKKMVELGPDNRPDGDYEPFTPNTKRLKLASGNNNFASSTKTYSKNDGRDKSHEILLADTLNLFVQLDVPFEKLNSDVWQTFVKKHIKNGDLILKNFTFYKTDT